MKGEVGFISMNTPPNGVLMMGPALQHGVRTPLSNLPFLRLGGQWQQQAQNAVPGQHTAPFTPWPLPYWMNPPARSSAASEAHASETTKQTDQTGMAHPAAGNRSLSPGSDAQDLQTLASLAPVLNWAAHRAGTQTHSQGDARRGHGPPVPLWGWTGRLDPALAGILSLAHAQSVAKTPVQSDPAPHMYFSGRAAEFTASAGSATPAVQQPPGRPVRPGKTGQLPSLGPNYSPDAPTRENDVLSSSGSEMPPDPITMPHPLRGVAILPDHARVMALPLTSDEMGVLVGSPDATMGHRLSEATPSPYFFTPLQGLTVVMSVVEHLVERQVKAEVKRRYEEMESQIRHQDRAEREPKITDVVNDEIVRALVKKMQTLNQEERFRLGRLR